MKQHWIQFYVVLLENPLSSNKNNTNNCPFLSYQSLSLVDLKLAMEKKHTYVYI